MLLFLRGDKEMGASKQIKQVMIEKNIKDGLLILEEDKMFLTLKGLELSNYVMSDFILEK